VDQLHGGCRRRVHADHANLALGNPDEQAAKQAAAERYGLTEQQLARLALREMR
jgi:hypothetical protein